MPGSRYPDPAPDPATAAMRARLERLAWLLDSSIRIPGLGWRVGLDALIGLIPGFGDVVGALLAAYILGEAARVGAPPPVLARMLGYVAVDAVVGAVPLAGDLFDAGFKANQRSVRLLGTYLDRPGRTTATSGAMVAAWVAAVLVVALGVAALAAWAVVALWQAFVN